MLNKRQMSPLKWKRRQKQRPWLTRKLQKKPLRRKKRPRPFVRNMLLKKQNVRKMPKKSRTIERRRRRKAKKRAKKRKTQVLRSLPSPARRAPCLASLLQRQDPVPHPTLARSQPRACVGATLRRVIASLTSHLGPSALIIRAIRQPSQVVTRPCPRNASARSRLANPTLTYQ